jgi:site-specific DNA-methyltransferase (adenine-specific)
VFDQAQRVLTKDGICCVNLGDTYINGCLQLIPSRFAKGMLDRGWILLNDLTWHKTNGKPESAKGRFTRDSESVYVFCKSKDHYFNLLFEPYRSDKRKRDKRVVEKDDRRNPRTPAKTRSAKNLVVPGQIPHGMHRARIAGKGRDIFDPRGRRMRSVWSLPVARCLKAHFAVWPPELVRRLILAGCPKGGTVLDPFVGSGTTLAVAIELYRRGIGIDLNAVFLEMAWENVLWATAKLKAAAEDS